MRSPACATIKRFIYLFQTPRDLPPLLESVESADSDVVFLSWLEKSSDPRSIHYPSSSWTQGRNRLLKEVMGRPYQYFIFGDGDVQLELTRHGHAAGRHGQNPWRVFEQFLLEHEPAVGCPAYDWHLVGGAYNEAAEVQTLRFFDAVLNAFHHEALPVLLPYYDLLDEASECYSQNLLCSLTADLYPGHVMQSNWIEAINTQTTRHDSEFLLSKPEHLYLDSLRNPARAREFLRQSYGWSARHPSMGPPRTKQQSYARCDEELARDHRLDHPLWVRKRELASLPADAEFFSADPNSARAQRRRSQRPFVAPPPASPLPLGLMQRFKLATLPFRLRVGLVRVERFTTWARPAGRYWSRRRARARWRKWLAQTHVPLEIPESQQLELLELLAAVFNDLNRDRIIFVDVGAGCGAILSLLGRAVPGKMLFSIGIDPIDARAHRDYSGYVLGAVASGPEGPADFFRYSASDCSSLKRMNVSSVSHDPADIPRGMYVTPGTIEQLEATLQVSTFRLDTLVRQYGLAGEVLDLVKIDAQGSDLDVFLSLGEFTRNCLFLRIETVFVTPGSPARLLYEGQTTWEKDRAAIEAAGFRVLNIGHFGVTPEADVTFVNVKLLRDLQWASGQRVIVPSSVDEALRPARPAEARPPLVGDASGTGI